MLKLYTFNHFSHIPSLSHGISTKDTNAPYDFSLALHTGENPSKIVNNRIRLNNAFSHNNTLHYVVANQTHSDHIKVINSSKTKGWHSISDAIEDCDAMITDVPNVVLTILTADCVPILLYDKKNHLVAAVHAGWKGTHAQISKKTVLKMIELFNTHPKDLLVGIAPSIGQCCYEVADNVAQHFKHIPHASKKKEDKYMLDLPYINKVQLLALGVQESNIEMSHICTACEVERFFSYRKEQGCSGRFMSMITLKDIYE